MNSRRNEQDMLRLITRVATDDKRIRAVGMEGSRTNRNVPKDEFQDYDISFLVTDVPSFTRDHRWVNVFGERLIMQMPTTMSLFPETMDSWFSYLMLFDDGNRIDLKLVPVEDKDLYGTKDKLLYILLDKDNFYPSPTIPTDKDYWVKRPSEAFFKDCCNEFWWISTYVAKGLCRKEILYANAHLTGYLRPTLIQMLEWQAGILTNFGKSMGKNQKYLDKYLGEQEWTKLLSTFNVGDYKSCWKSLFTQATLFGDTARFVASQLNFKYNQEEEDKVVEYLKDLFRTY